jgi:hypothetical protein
MKNYIANEKVPPRRLELYNKFQLYILTSTSGFLSTSFAKRQKITTQ